MVLEAMNEAAAEYRREHGKDAGFLGKFAADTGRQKGRRGRPHTQAIL